MSYNIRCTFRDLCSPKQLIFRQITVGESITDYGKYGTLWDRKVSQMNSGHTAWVDKVIVRTPRVSIRLHIRPSLYKSFLCKHRVARGTRQAQMTNLRNTSLRVVQWRD